MYKTSTAQDHNHRNAYGGSLIYQHSASALESPAIEIIEDKLFWISGTTPPTSESENAYYFSVDNVRARENSLYKNIVKLP